MVLRHTLVVFTFCLVTALGSLAPSANARDIESKYILGQTVNVQDGDTITVKDDDGKIIRIQMAYIDAPDMNSTSGKKQPLHAESMDTLIKMIGGKQIIIKKMGMDRFGRMKGMVFLGRLNVNIEMVRKGMAEIYHPVRVNPKQFDKRYVAILNEAEESAKKDKTGVWGLPDYISPYQFRRRK